MTELRFPWENDPAARALPPRAPVPKPPGRQGRRPARPSKSATAHPWTYHHLTISGLASDVASFAAAARGPGVVPWALDYAAIEEGIFTLATAPPPNRRTLTIEGCRILARQFRQHVEARQDRAVARIGLSRACPFDLQTLLPIPPHVLALGPDDPAARGWLQANWGTDALRHIVERPTPANSSIGYAFFTHAGTPAVAITRLQRHWPNLLMVIEPRPLG